MYFIGPHQWSPPYRRKGGGLPSPTILHANMTLLLRRYDMAIAQSRAMMDEAVTEEKWCAAADLVSAACTLSGLISQLTIEVAEEETAVQPPHDETPRAVALAMLVRAAAATCTEDETPGACFPAGATTTATPTMTCTTGGKVKTPHKALKNKPPPPPPPDRGLTAARKPVPPPPPNRDWTTTTAMSIAWSNSGIT